MTKRIRVDVVGLLSAQAHCVSQRADHQRFKLRFLGARDRKPFCGDHIILVTKFIGHRVSKKVKGQRVHYANGLIESVLTVLDNIA